jgi:methylenetetrahydrofolate dehydrogenase (NADP+)/methenyltetrahydrofolate cyclohydrolase
VINGEYIAEHLRLSLAEQCQTVTHQLNRVPRLDVFLVGDHVPSQLYVGMKQKRCAEVGIHSVLHACDRSISEVTLIERIHAVNDNPDVDGILVQLPLPTSINTESVLNALSPLKDVDGLTPSNLGHVVRGHPVFVPCTPLGCMHLIKAVYPDVSGANAVVIGRSTLVGRPLALVLENANATVTVCHSHTRHLAEVTRQADILIAACGKPHFIKANHVKKGACVIDVGIHRLDDGRIIGDVDFDSVYEHVSAITPVPKGVGPMTVAYLLSNTLLSAARKIHGNHARTSA